MGRASGLLPYEEQIPGERYRQGERIRAFLYRVEETPRGIFLRLSRSHPKFLIKLFEAEAPEIANALAVGSHFWQLRSNSASRIAASAPCLAMDWSAVAREILNSLKTPVAIDTLSDTITKVTMSTINSAAPRWRASAAGRIKFVVGRIRFMAVGWPCGFDCAGQWCW